MRDYQVTIDQTTFAIREWGDPDAPVMIALHGWLDNAASFTHIASHLTTHRIIAPDLAGHGWSSHRAHRHYYLWEHIADIIALADHLQCEQFSLLGHSMGAMIAALIAGTFPERIPYLLLIDGLAPYYLTEQHSPQWLAQSIYQPIKQSSRVFANRHQAIVARMNGLTPLSYQAAELLAERGTVTLNDGQVRWSADLALQQASPIRLTPGHIRAFLQRIRAKSLLVLAEQGILPLSDVHHWQQDFPSLNLITLAGGHHLHLELEHCTKLVTILQDFISNAP